MLDGIFIGATRTRDMRNGMVLALIIFISFSILLIPGRGYDGLWISLIIFMGARGLTLAVSYPKIEKDLKMVRGRPHAMKDPQKMIQKRSKHSTGETPRHEWSSKNDPKKV